MNCNGLSHLECPARNCRSGVVVGRKAEFLASPQGPVRRWVPTQSRCSTCGGTGRVSCPYCSNGFDSSL
jgi:hypothetical protein